MAASQIECEQFFLNLSKSLPTIWRNVAISCGLASDEIETIKRNDPEVEAGPLNFLIGLRKKYPVLKDWSKTLIVALGIEDRNDLVEKVEKFVLKVTQEDSMGEEIPPMTSNTPNRPPEERSVTEDLESSNGRILKTASQNLPNTSSKKEGPSGTAAMKTPKRKQTNPKVTDAEENAASCSCSKIKKGKKEKKEIQPLPPPCGEQKLIRDISEAGAHQWHLKAWLDHWCPGGSAKGPVKGNGNYFAHCFLRDDSEHKIYVSIFCKYKKDCSDYWKLFKGSTEENKLYLRLLEVQDVQPQYVGKPGKSNYRLIVNNHSKVSEAYVFK